MRKKIVLTSVALLGILLLFYFFKIAFTAISNRPNDVNNIRTLLELISLASSPLVLIVALLGLRQLYFAQKQIDVAKDIFKKQSIRESFQISANECRNFSDNVMPYIVKIDKFVEKNKITLFTDAKIIEEDKGFKVDYTKVNKKQIEKFIEIEDDVRKYLHGMELFALHFVSRIADDNIGFLTMGILYVEEVERMAIILPFFGGSQDDTKAVWPLYFSWKSRLQKIKLEKEKSEIETKLKTIKYEPKKAIGAE